MKSSEILYKNVELVKNMLVAKNTYSEIAKVFEVTRSVVAGFVDRNLKKADNVTLKKVGGVVRVFDNIVTILSKPIAVSETKSSNQCKFLYGDKVPYRNCEKYIVKGSYCQEHNNLCYRRNLK